MGPLQRPADQQKSFDITSLKTSVRIRSLEPCGSYNLSITSMSLNGSITLATNETFLMDEDGELSYFSNIYYISIFILLILLEPSEVIGLKFHLNPKKVNLTWKPPMYAELCITEYKLAGWNEEKYPYPAFEALTSNLTVIIEKLYSCESYLVHINANTKYLSGKIFEFGINTMADFATPSKLQVTGVSSNHIEIKAHINDPTNKCDIIFARIICRATTNVTHRVSSIYNKLNKKYIFYIKILLKIVIHYRILRNTFMAIL